MANNHSTLTGLFTDIADAIRVKTGGSENIVADNFPEAINAIETCPDDALFLKSEANPIRIEGAQGEYIATAYGNGKFVAMDCNYGNTMYSTDGITWVRGTSSINGAWMSVVYGCNKFVAVSAHDKYQIAYSIDGITWTMTTAPNPAEMILVGFTTITYVNNRFIAYCICYDADNNVVPAVAYSTDGISWQTTALSIPSFIEKVTYGNEKFVGIFMRGADGGATNISVYSVDGITWETATLPISAYWRFVAYGNGKFVAIPFCDANMEDTNVIAYSNDGISWESATLPITDDWVSVTYGKDKFVIVGKSTAVYSTDGITWTEITMPNSVLSGEGFWQQIIYGNNMFVVLSSSFYDKALNNSVVAVAISEDGINWTTTITNAAITNVSGADVTEETVQATKLLDDELATQDDLIAQVVTALEGKSVAETKKTVSVTISVTSDASNSVMFLKGDRSYEVINGGNTVIADVLNGVVSLVSSASVKVDSTGDYKDLGFGATMFFSDGGTYKVTKFVNQGGSN